MYLPLHSTYIPSINLQNEAAVIKSFYLLQNPDRGDEVQPIIVLVAGLEDQPKMYLGIRLRSTRSLDKDICAVICLQIVPRIRSKYSCLRVGQAPVCAEV